MPSSSETSLSENPFNVEFKINHNRNTVKAFFQEHEESQACMGVGKDKIHVVNAFGLPWGLIISVYDTGPNAFQEVRMSYDK